MKVHRTRLDGPLLIEPDVHGDDRGFFLETFRRDAYSEVGITCDFVQENHSRSSVGTLRGLHYQAKPGQPKLVRVVRGRIFDAVVDIRQGSPTFGNYESFELDDEGLWQLFVPAGFAHGFLALSDVADVTYKVGSYYDPLTERGIAWDDPDVGIEWPLSSPLLSQRDRANPRLRHVAAELTG